VNQRALAFSLLVRSQVAQGESAVDLARRSFLPDKWSEAATAPQEKQPPFAEALQLLSNNEK
jgi:hypothetical protein